MLNRLTASQKRGALLLLLILVLVIGWRGRVAYLEAQKSLPEGAADQSQLAGAATNASPQAGKEVVRVELNTADTATLRQVKGIGPAYARRIVTFRETYGGIVDPQQLITALRLEPDAWLRIEPQVYADTTGEAFLRLRAQASEKQAYLRTLTANSSTRSSGHPATSTVEMRPAPMNPAGMRLAATPTRTFQEKQSRPAPASRPSM